MTVLGIGHDILVTSRILNIISKSPRRFDSFSQRILHPTERCKLSQDPQVACRLLASTWAAKEALYKSLDQEDQKIFQFKHWYRTVQDGKRILKNNSYKKEDEFLVSISHDGDYTSAFVIRKLRASSHE